MFCSYWFILSMLFLLENDWNFQNSKWTIVDPAFSLLLQPWNTKPSTPKIVFEPVLGPFSSKDLIMKASPSTIANILSPWRPNISSVLVIERQTPRPSNKSTDKEKQRCASTTLPGCGSTLPSYPLFSPSLQLWTGRQWFLWKNFICMTFITSCF